MIRLQGILVYYGVIYQAIPLELKSNVINQYNRGNRNHHHHNNLTYSYHPPVQWKFG